MNIINPDLPKTFRRDSPPGAGAAAGIAAGIAAGRISPADEITKNIFYLAARKFPKKEAPQKSAAARPVILNLRDVDLKKKARGLKALPIWFILQNVHDIGRRDVAEFFRLCGDLSERDRRFLGPRGLAYLMRHNPRWTAGDLAEIERKAIKKKGGIMTVSYYQEDLNKARQKGMQAGMQKGRQEGIQTGMQKGRHEGLQAGHEKVALNMLRENLDASLIAKVTGLSAKKIRRLKNGAAE